jgi:valyl-tRNA synthetase
VATTAEEALELAKQRRNQEMTVDNLRQDQDTLDTWFSAWLWPMSVFDGF